MTIFGGSIGRCGPNWLGAHGAPAMTVSTITGASDYRRE
jgi:hypothetical protein